MAPPLPKRTQRNRVGFDSLFFFGWIGSTSVGPLACEVPPSPYPRPGVGVFTVPPRLGRPATRCMCPRACGHLSANVAFTVASHQPHIAEPPPPPCEGPRGPAVEGGHHRADCPRDGSDSPRASHRALRGGKATGGSAGPTDLIAFGHHIEFGPRQSGLPTQRI